MFTPRRPSFGQNEFNSSLSSHTAVSQSTAYNMDGLFPEQRDRYPVGPLKGLPDGFSHSASADLEEACLIRHFTENLAPWVRFCLSVY